MSRQMIHFAFLLALLLIGTWLLMGYVLPIGLPFLLGLALALAAEPAVSMLNGKLGFPRGGAAALGVSAVFLLTVTLLFLLLGFLGRQLQQLTGILPQVEATITQATDLLQAWLTALANKLPAAIGIPFAEWTAQLFSGGSAIVEQATMLIPKLASSLLGSLSNGLLGLITGMISAYMISGRLPALRQWWQEHQIPHWQDKWIPALRELKKALGGWLLAQLKLAGLALIMMSAGFLLLRIPHSLLWAGIITLVDAFPILGVGTVLVPWAVVCLLQDNAVRGFGLLAIYGVVWLSRSVLEPKLVGKGLGLDPLVTLIAIYAGWKLWGIPGMLLAPILALTATQIIKQLQK